MACSAEKPTTTAAIAATAGMVLMSGSTIANALFHSTGGGATESNENVYTSASGKRIAPPGRLPARIERSRRRRHGVRRSRAVRDVGHARRTRGHSCRPGSRPTRGRTSATSIALDLRDRGVSGRLVSVTLIGSAGSRTVSGEIFRAVFNARRPAGRPQPQEHAPGHRADPLTSGYRARMIERTRTVRLGRRRSARPGPADGRYHDDEWGVPVHDDTELFERLALESFQAGLSWITILRKREAFREAFRGFDPAVVAAFDDGDRARLMADAGIVRNRAKIDATIGNAAALLAIGRGATASFERYLARWCRRRRRACRATAIPGDIPASTPVSDALSADLRRRGLRFVGSTIVYAFMQSVGLVDDHLPGCFRYAGRSLTA